MGNFDERSAQVLNVPQFPTKYIDMTLGDRWRALRQNPAARLVLLVIGCVLMVSAPLVGIIPGPGGTVVFAIGLGLVLQTSLWARRQYVIFKRKQPKMGGWADWGLRRQSPKRRDERAKREGEQP